MKNINSKQFKEIIESTPNAIILDVRTEGEIQEGMIEGARNINIMSPNFANEIKALDKENTYLVVCRSGNRSSSACGFMDQLVFKQVYNLSGGMMQWDGNVVIK